MQPFEQNRLADVELYSTDYWRQWKVKYPLPVENGNEFHLHHSSTSKELDLKPKQSRRRKISCYSADRNSKNAGFLANSIRFQYNRESSGRGCCLDKMEKQTQKQPLKDPHQHISRIRGGTIGLSTRHDWESSTKSKNQEPACGPGSYKPQCSIGTKNILSTQKSAPNLEFNRATRGSIISSRRSATYNPNINAIKPNIPSIAFPIATRFSSDDCSNNSQPVYHSKRAHDNQNINNERLKINLLSRKAPDIQSVTNFGFSCSIEEHIKFGKCLDGKCLDRGNWEKKFNHKNKTIQKASALHTAIKCNNLPLVKQLVASYKNLNETDEEGQTALHVAAKLGNLDAVIELCLATQLSQNRELVNVNKQDFAGKTPLHEAVGQDHFHIVEFLLKHGADTEVSDLNKKTPIAFCKHNQQIFQVLRQHSMTLDLRDKLRSVNFRIHTIEHQERIKDAEVLNG